MAITSDHDRSRALRELAAAFERPPLSADAGAPLDVQLLVQVVRAEVFRTWRAERDAAWAAQDGGYSSAGWPVTKLRDSEYAALILPLPAGRVGPAVGRHPAVIADPLFASGTPRRAGDYGDLVLGLVAAWLFAVGASLPVRLAPPAIETIGRRGVLARRIEPFELEWHLPAPEGA